MTDSSGDGDTFNVIAVSSVVNTSRVTVAVDADQSAFVTLVLEIVILIVMFILSILLNIVIVIIHVNNHSLKTVSNRYRTDALALLLFFCLWVDSSQLPRMIINACYVS